ncbi:MAG: hypothetical protein Q4E91_07825 [Lachnospiraceae bacterium]|nr:hypothetical protein [Lachnospiraceae bacterium]
MGLTKQKKGRKRYIALLFLTMLLSLAGTSLAAQAGTASGGGVVAVASRHRVSNGKWVKTSKGLRYKKKSGAYIKNSWCMINKSVYYFDKKGYVETGSFTYGGHHYYADAKGRLSINKLVKIGSKTYYYGSKGSRIWGMWKTINGKTYYFDRLGAMVKNSWVGNRYVGKDGALVKNRTIQGRRINSQGVAQSLAKNDKYIVVGASRIEDMSVAVSSSKTIFIARSGKGYQWLKSTGYPQLKKYLEQNGNCKVIFNLGNNDTEDINLYIQLYRKIIKEYPKTKFYFLDVLPGAKSAADKNAARRAFNKKMKAAFGSRCIGGYDYLMQTGFSLVDKTHYTTDTSKKIYRYIMNKVA